MLFFASIAFTLLLSLAQISVLSAPLAVRQRVTPQACTGPNGTGVCVPLNVSPPGSTDGNCINVNNTIQSLILNDDDECISYSSTDCVLTADAPGDLIAANSHNLPGGINSLVC
ncbi:hypothetical protein B0H10DRAFT_2427073 [Mycena sp. CBHHK59/15]|nr:hypothetical protein B0H10DRAFT_2427073 [Mycena sp. CBHHK59/15]